MKMLREHLLQNRLDEGCGNIFGVVSISKRIENNFKLI